MRLRSIKYQEWEQTPQEWRLETVTFGPRMLVVGRNASGKSRTLAITAALARNLVGIQPPALSGNYVVTFDHDEREYIYELHYHELEVVHERIVIDGKEYLSREPGGAGKILAEKIGTGTFMDFQVPTNILAAVARRDAIQHSFIEPLFNWANSFRYYQFGQIAQNSLAFFTPGGQKVDDRDQNAVVGIFREGQKLFGDSFVESIKADLHAIDYEIDDLLLTPPVSVRFNGNGPIPLTVSAREHGLLGLTDQIGMSTGMFRVIALLIHVNFAQFKGSASSVFVDDIGEGLDFDRSCRLIELLRSKAIAHKFQLVMSTNDKFVMNHVPLEEWTVLHRKGHVVEVMNYANSKDHFDQFKFTGLSNFSFFEMNANELSAVELATQQDEDVDDEGYDFPNRRKHDV
ncbi:ATP-binding protein [Paraburkholderia caribensis]|uniref:ATP-binding protein n=1 Tax=Paraburkholderia caribensis TaxID=75105 RepID=A0ABV0E3G6_9BURK|nr:ATP-binding protein [Paraburkholderia caribensis]MCO4879561.1 ATP-binding protein [Paraburkholderia caribensis]